MYSSLTNKCIFINLKNIKIYIRTQINIALIWFSTIIRELAMNLARVTFMLKHSVKFTDLTAFLIISRYFLL